MENLIGKIGVFISYEDKAWGSYAGKEAKITSVEVDMLDGTVEYEIEFLHDGQTLGIDAGEFEFI